MSTKVTERELKREEIREKIVKAYDRMKQRTHDRNSKRNHGSATWKPRVHDKILVRTQPSSDVTAGVTGKFIRLYEGPCMISKVVPPPAVEICDRNGKNRGQFSLKSIKVYKEVTDKM